ncbi:hypothetical protein F5B20DRAFT_234379 [Whalleya microplaca]|nr:hypothetical protein F5B20DRAFT_234379 [Whalleya microplaca]
MAMNAPLVSDEDDAHLLRCWAIQNCQGCLEQTDCSWCPFSWTCNPNPSPQPLIPLLAPAFHENICPHWAERWELRARPLGCQVSTITALTAVVSVAGTLVLGLLVWGAVWGGRWVGRRFGVGGKGLGWWRRGLRVRLWTGLGRKGRGNGGGDGGDTLEQRGEREREPLLPSSQPPPAAEA